MAYKHIIWDYNGTMLDDTELCVSVINEMLKERNLAGVTTEQYKQEFDFPVKDYYERVGFDFEKENFDVVGEDFIVRYNKRYGELNLHEGIYDLIKSIHKSGTEQSVLSARKESELKTELDKFNLTPFFKHISGLTDNLAHGKLQNGINLRRKLSFNDSEIVLIGDTTHDCATADAMRINCIAVSHGHHTREKLKQCNSFTFGNISELRMHLLQNL